MKPRRVGAAGGVAALATLYLTNASWLAPEPAGPTRWLAHTFPEGWQLGALALEPWAGPVP